MPRRRQQRQRADSDSDRESFRTPSPQEGTTNYSFEYSTRNSRTLNRNEPSTSAAARQKFYARKSTAAGPHGRNAPEREQMSRSHRAAELSPNRHLARNLSSMQIAQCQPSQRQPTLQQQAPQHRRKQRKPMSAQMRLHREIIRLQQHTGFLVPKAPFARLFREIMQNTSDTVTHITKTALECVQESCEQYLVQVLTDAYALTLHRGRMTLMPKDIQLLRVIRLIE